MLWVGQFGITSGQAQEATPWVGLFPEDVHSPESSDLYLVVTPASVGSEAHCAELKDAVGTMFHKSKASLTGGLLRALQAAHEQLREWNRSSMRDQRIAAGISCVAVRGHEAYLAQVAPAAAIVSQGGKTRRQCPILADAAEPLGLFDEFWPEFARYELAKGDRLLLLSPALADRLSEDDGAAALAGSSPDEVLPALYRHARALPDCGAILLAAVTDAEAGIDAEPEND
jgi:hypothetical protein